MEILEAIDWMKFFESPYFHLFLTLFLGAWFVWMLIYIFNEEPKGFDKETRKMLDDWQAELDKEKRLIEEADLWKSLTR